MIQLPFPSTIEAQPRNVTFLTIQFVSEKSRKNDGQTGSCAWTRQCLDKGGGGTPYVQARKKYQINVVPLRTIAETRL